MTEQRRYEWIKQVEGVKMLCDYGDCQAGSMLYCTECRASLCLNHTEQHLQTCGMPDGLGYEMERTPEAKSPEEAEL